MVSWAAVTRLLLIALLCGGCATLTAPFRAQQSGYSEQDLYEDLARYAARFSMMVSAAADEIADVAESRRVRRSTLIWKLRMIPLVQESAFGADPQGSFVEVLGLAIAQRQYLSEGPGREIFGPHQEIAAEAARELEAQARVIGLNFLDDEQLQMLVAQVEKLATENPIRGRDFSVEAVQVGLAKVEAGSAGVGWVVGVPLSPFRAMEGVGTAGSAMLEMNRTALEFADIVDELPRQNRWQIELLLFDIEERDTVRQGLAAFEQVAASADRVSLAIDRLPDDLRVVFEDSQGALRDANQTLQTANELMVPVAATVEELGQITALIAEMQSGADERAVDEPPGRPFDIREYESTARAVSETVAELRALTVDLRELLGSGKLDGAILNTVNRTEEEVGNLINRVTQSAIAVLVLFFVLLLAYRWLSSRIARTAA